MRGFGSRLNRSSPSPPTNPPEPSQTHREHAIDVEPSGVDVDGFSAEEEENVTGDPLVAFQEYYPCNRDGCDEGMTRRLLFTTETLDGDELQRLQEAAKYEIAEYVYQHCKQDGHESIVVYMPTDSISITAEEISESGGRGPCHGHEDKATRLGI